jgi:hypothetical protein
MKKGKILKVKLGSNPNSSSLGADLGILLIGATGISVLTAFFGSAIRGWLGKGRLKKDEGA